MPTIYSRFMEKEAREWRQIYKALTLLEFLVKNGSERVVDDARAHISTIKMLRSFHYIDEKGKDQGINVRNRASEIASLLGDVDRIRAERRKAKANKSKYQGSGNDGGGGMSFATASGGRYGGFGSESLGYGADVGGSRGGGGGGGGDRDYGRSEYGHRADDYSSRPRAPRQAAPEYDEYEGADDFESGPPRRSTPHSASSQSRPSSSRPQPPPKSRAPPKAEAVVEQPKEKVKEVDLFDFADDEPVAPAGGSSAAPILGGDDDFDDFQTAPSAPVSSPPIQASKPAAAAGNAGLFDLLNAAPASTPTAPQTTSFAPMTSMAAPMQPAGMASMSAKPNYTSPVSAASTQQKPTAPAPSKGSTFDDLFTTSLSSISTAKPSASGPVKGKSILEMQREKADAQLWGSGAGTGASDQGSQAKGGFDDLLF